MADLPPTTTVLEYLRNHAQRVGTKEGCGEGDCGACTVAVGQVVDGKMQYRAVNACIQFLPTLDGCQLLTVEDLSDLTGNMHPVQNAMVKYHGSQCGFCTPGFVMSLYCLYRQGGDTDRATVDDALAGNLCRCTGYGTIAAAAANMHSLAGPDLPQQYENQTVACLDTYKRTKMVHLSVRNQQYFAPTTADELAEVYLSHPDARLLAGGTDMGLWVTKQLRHLEKIIFLGNVSELNRIEVTDDEIGIWAGATLADVMAVIAEFYPDFGELLRRFGSTQIRNLGTLCGNIANGSPIGDTPPALIALDAMVTLRKGSARRIVPIESFFIDYGKQDRQRGEFVEKVSIPIHKNGFFHAYKLSKRFDQDISSVCGAFRVVLNEQNKVKYIRIAFGGMAAIPKHAIHVESTIRNASWDERTLRQAMDAMPTDFQPISDMRASAEYRMQAAQNLLYKFFLQTTGHPVEGLRLVS